MLFINETSSAEIKNLIFKRLDLQNENINIHKHYMFFLSLNLKIGFLLVNFAPI